MVSGVVKYGMCCHKECFDLIRGQNERKLILGLVRGAWKWIEKR